MRKPRNDAIPAAVKAMEAAASPVHPPASVPLRAAELRFFAAIVDEAARSEWTAHSLEIAAMLARSMAALEEEQRLLRAEGSVLTSDLGTRTPNQRVSVVASLTSAVLAFRRSLQLHARARRGTWRPPRRVGARSRRSRPTSPARQPAVVRRPRWRQKSSLQKSAK